MKLNFSVDENGIYAKAKKSYSLLFPKKIWGSYLDKAFFLDNYALLSTICMPLVAGIKKIEYNTSLPLFREQFSKMILGDIPCSTEDYKKSTTKTIDQFKKTKYIFSDNFTKEPSTKIDSEERAVIPLSCGKDSLLTFGVAKEIGLNPVGIYINDTVSPSENKIKKLFIEKLAKQENFDYYILENTLEKLNDFETWNTAESCLGYGHMVTSFCFASLPFLNFYNARYIMLGNQQDLDWGIKNKEGFVIYPSFDQTSEWQAEQNNMTKKATNSTAEVTSILRPLTDLGVMHILFSRYKELAKYIVSCYGLDASNKKRWCAECSGCATYSLFMLAVGADTNVVGLSPMLEKKHEKFYRLFKGKETEFYDNSKNARDKQLLAFYMAMKKGAKGYLIEKFKKTFLKEAQEREDELMKFFFSLHKADIPKEIKSPVLSIYKEELKKVN